MPVGHPLFLFSIGERTTYASNVLLHKHIGLSAVRQRALPKLSLKLTEVDQTWLNLSWAGCARPEIAILKLSTRGPSLFSDRNEKMGLDGAMVHLEG